MFFNKKIIETALFTGLVLFISSAAAYGQKMLVPETIEPYKLKLIAGKSIVMKIGLPVQKTLRISVGEPNIADCLALPPDEIYIQGKKPGVTNIMVWQENSLAAVYDLEVSLDTSALKEKMHLLLPNENELMITSSQDSISLMGRVSNSSGLNQAMELARSFAPDGKVNNLVQVGGIHQVMLEVKMAEISRNIGKKMGLDGLWANGGEFALVNLSSLITPDLIDASGLVDSTLSPAINSILRFNSGSSSWSAFINALQEDGFAKILAEPNLISLSGQTASFLAGGEFPIPVPDRDRIAIQYKDYGVGLSFTPTVLSENKINIQVSSKVSELDFSTALQFSGYVVPGVTLRRAATTIELRDGQSFAVAGLISQNIKENVKKFPLLGDLPILGILFKSTSFQKNETELLVIVTPRLVKPLDNANQPLPTDYYTEPDDLEIFLNVKKLSNSNSGPDNNSESIDGKFGHSFESE